MARRGKSYEEQLEVLNEQIARCQDKLNNLMAQREELSEKKQQEELQDLYTLMKTNHLTVSDVEKLLNNAAIPQPA